MVTELSDLIVARTSATPTDLAMGTITDLVGGITIDGQANVVDGGVTSYSPQVGDSVLVLRQGSRLHIVGALMSTMAPQVGTVTVIAAPQVTVSTPQGSFTLFYLASYTTPLVGDTVLIGWFGTVGIVLGKMLSVLPAPVPPDQVPAPPEPVSSSGETTFTSKGQSTWRSGGWRTDTDDAIQGLYGGIANNGAWFYSAQPFNTLSGATITRADVYLIRGQGGSSATQAVHLQRHSSLARPAGNVAYTLDVYDITLGVGQEGWFQIPTAWGQWLVTAPSGGIGITADPYVRLTGPSVNGQAGALRLAWTY